MSYVLNYQVDNIFLVCEISYRCLDVVRRFPWKYMCSHTKSSGDRRSAELFPAAAAGGAPSPPPPPLTPHPPPHREGKRERGGGRGGGGGGGGREGKKLT